MVFFTICTAVLHRALFILVQMSTEQEPSKLHLPVALVHLQ